jgi:hypothetical protein
MGGSTPNSELRTPNSELRTPNSELRTPNSELRTPNSELRTLNAQRSTLNASRSLRGGILGPRRLRSQTVTRRLGGNPDLRSSIFDIRPTCCSRCRHHCCRRRRNLRNYRRNPLPSYAEIRGKRESGRIAGGGDGRRSPMQRSRRYCVCAESSRCCCSRRPGPNRSPFDWTARMLPQMRCRSLRRR